MATPRFSVVIPTRNRARYLRASIRTVLHQRFQDFEVVVSDNCSNPETKQVVDGFQDPRLRYYRSDVPLAMTDNWETAISQAKGEYVIVIGDDDGLLPYSLEALN